MQTKLFLSVFFVCLSSLAPCHAQGGSPLPGPGDATSNAPLPGAELRPPNNVFPENGQRLSAPAPAQIQAPTPGRTGRTAYGHLPLTVKDAKNRLVELRTALAVTRPHDLQEPIYQLSEWLGDSADAHNKMANAFSKHDELKAQYMAEKQIGLKFGQLKRDAQLLKADLLIAEKRYPEALGPLVDIVLADPTSATGKTAYQRLKDLGFSHNFDANDVTSSAPSPDLHSSTSSSLASNTLVQTTVKAAVKQPSKPIGKTVSKAVIRTNFTLNKRKSH